MEIELNENKELWSAIKNSLKIKNSNNKLLQTWFEPTELISVITDKNGHSKMRLGVPTKLHKYWIIENLFDRICLEISAVYKGGFEIEFEVTGQTQAPLKPEGDGSEVQSIDSQQSPQLKKPPSRQDALNRNYSFSTFVVGRNNEFAHAASYNVAQNPGVGGYNPLFICGPVGMGKTHLLNAVGNQIRENRPELRVVYISAERFMNEVVSNIHRKTMESFRNKFRNQCDVLLMDDGQFLGRGQATPEEFFHTINHFFEKNLQVVVASDRMPKDINGLEDRIRSRLEWGLIADIQMPDLETRIAILRYKAEQIGFSLPGEVINYISRISKRSIRELEGNLNKVKMFAELQGLKMNLEIAKKILSIHDDPASISLEEIQKLASEHYDIKISELKSKGRSKPVVIARQVAMYLIKKHLDKSLVDIGRAFGGRDHTTVISAVRKITNLQTKNLDLKRDIEELTNKIHNITGM